MNEGTIVIRLYWQDLTEKKQQELLRLFGDNGNWDCIPMTVIEIDNSTRDSSNYPGKDIVVDSFLGNEGF